MSSPGPPSDTPGPALEEDKDPATSMHETAPGTQHPMRARTPVMDSRGQAEEEGRDPTTSSRETAPDTQGPVTTTRLPRAGLMLPVGILDPEVQADKHVPRNSQEMAPGTQGRITMRLPLRQTAPDTHSRARDHQRAPGPAGTGDPALARRVTARDIQKTPRGGLGPVPEAIMGPLGSSREMAPGTAGPITETEPVTGTLQTAPDDQAPVTQRLPLVGGLRLPTSRQHQVQEEDTDPATSTQQTALDTQALAADSPHLQSATMHTRRPVAVRPVTARRIQKTQTHSQCQATDRLGTVSRATMSLHATDTPGLALEEDKDPATSMHETAPGTQRPMRARTPVVDSQGQAEEEGRDPTTSSRETAPDTQGPITATRLPRAGLMLPVGILDPEVQADKHVPRNSQETAPGTQGRITMRLPLGQTAPDTHSRARDHQRAPGPAGAEDPALARRVTARDTQKTPRGGLGPVPETIMGPLGSSREMAPGTAGPITETEPVTGTLQTAPDDQAPVTQRLPLVGGLRLPTSRQHQVQEEDTDPATSTQQTALDTQALAADSPHLQSATMHTRRPVAVRPVTARRIQKTQTHSQCQATDRLGTVSRATMSPHMAGQGKGLDVQALSSTR
ncbi:hypothetical protein P7K49_037322 [Saguinus oedipus]|uniref:Uncharacterized protein n=1 Tax=Saguinus oedipus TaxID=9490 RepID=A0ABQ9THS3_SAGOE|nr:hypothetical protein P7K49_037322 [Saguinus oedipus]